MTRSSPNQLDAIIDDLTVDAYGDDEQLSGSGLLVGADEALDCGGVRVDRRGGVEILAIDSGPGQRTGFLTRICRDGQHYDVTLAGLAFPADSELGRVAAAYRPWQGRG